MTILTGQLQHTTLGYPFAIGQRADLLKATLMKDPEKPIAVAVKVLRVVPLSDMAARQDLRNCIESRLASWEALDHVNVCRLLGVSYDRPFAAALVLPYYRHGNVSTYINKNPGVNLYALIKGAAEGLNYLHSQSPPLVHGDLRGSNVLVDNDGNARLVDFGLVNALKSANFTTTHVTGPARWQAPEIFLTEGAPVTPFTVKSDVFSFAMLGVEILTKDRPYNHRKLDTVVIVDITRGLRPRKPPSCQLSDRLWPIFEDCWRSNPTERPSMQTVCERLH